MATVAPDLTTGTAVAMASDISALMSANLQGIAQVTQNDFVTVAKALDNDYMEGHRVISLPEALGAREVQSKVTPGGPQPATIKPGG